ncbi:ATP-binding protein [Leptolyngbya sp. AN02str]|uniref:ATP-binding protein n=1 Tax=Leptolyngbya sp. AN02str TaxID=3423363 RepID=UPI003D313C4A
MIDAQKNRATQQWHTALDRLILLSYRSYDLNSYLHEMTQAVSQLLESDWSIVTLCEATRVKIIASTLDISDSEKEYEVHESISEIVLRSGRPYLIEDAHNHSEEMERMEGYVCYLGVPLKSSQGRIIGTICSFSMHPQWYNAQIIATVEQFAERIATALDNYCLYYQQQESNGVLAAEITKRTLELHEAQAKLIEHERLAAIGEFAAMIVHEIRNPLTTIQMGLNYFAKLELHQSARSRLLLAMDEAKRLGNLLQEILSYSKPQILRFTEINIDSLIQELLILLRSMPEAEGRSIEYVPVVLPLLISGDSEKLKQVFINLIRNACEAAQSGDTIRWVVQVSSPSHICISVHNGGVPIPADVLSRVMQPFYSTKPEGTGLGLAIAKRIVEAHHGQLLVESSEAKGTIFTVRLPMYH